ncbi:HAMP domain-containing histidine kinase [Ornithinibacillus gellani]|uniref:sensor histidine kinase n=1 Tax=Ornithinibacillus gellani TaxID=2293253 RepID=UPI000F4AF118|nr:HAMP domain-containing sensor histidine kinase [Ornithinibacillus gellani]TQS74241.1 HAMP domain-containing histidine kinase [Ornithinibacillus gellani]
MKKFSHSIVLKCIAFVVLIAYFTLIIQTIVHVEEENKGDYEIVLQDNYFHGTDFMHESGFLVDDLVELLQVYKSEEHILDGGTLNKDEYRFQLNELYDEYLDLADLEYMEDPEQDEAFTKQYKDEIAHIKESMIQSDLSTFHSLQNRIEQTTSGKFFYASNGKETFSNSKLKDKKQFKEFPAYLIFEGQRRDVFPSEIDDDGYMYWVDGNLSNGAPKDQVIYLAFTQDFLDQHIFEWKEHKAEVTNVVYRLLAYAAVGLFAFIYLIVVSGRKPEDKAIHLHPIDRLFVDVNILLCISLSVFWFFLFDMVYFQMSTKWAAPITVPLTAAVAILLFSLIRHLKNGTWYKHTLIYQVVGHLFRFIGEVYKSGNVGVKTVILVIVYPLLIAATFFIFPITIGAAAWFTLKKVKEFNAIQTGVARIKEGELRHQIAVEGNGEFATLATNINSIADGLQHAVDGELKSERLKTELITNVSHDIRTPLTSIITYVDLLKQETDPEKMKGYIEILDQKSKRLKYLTDDLFEAAKATSGNIPVALEQIDLASLVTQGLGEVSEKMAEKHLEFRFQPPKQKIFIKADGKLLWRSIENVLSNIYKYALEGSRVYIEITEVEKDVLLTFKNISAYELNISADELMERFKRGDESRTSQGSGLGLSIARSLIDMQRGRFMIDIDGDLFKSMIYMPKAEVDEEN